MQKTLLLLLCILCLLWSNSYAKNGDEIHPLPKNEVWSVTTATQKSIEVNLKPNTCYRIVASMCTESGADYVTLSVDGLGAGNVNLSTAKTDWTHVEQEFHTNKQQDRIRLTLALGQTAVSTTARVNSLVIIEKGAYEELSAKTLSALPVREVKTDMGITMQPDDKIQWMRDARIGMFVHWGLYSGPGRGEWYMENNGICPEEYRKLAYPESKDLYFDANEFDVHAWTTLAKRMGARYMTLVTQHHDGYALFESKYMNAFTSMQTHNRDFVREFVDACRADSLRIGLYKTLINWRYPGYYDINGIDCKKNKFGYTTAPWHHENARVMKEELYCQVQELMSNYGPIDLLFWDGGWVAQQGSDADGAPFWESGKYLDSENQWPVNPLFQMKDSTGRSLGVMGMVRQLQPDIVCNPRSGWIGDYTCEEGSSDVKGPIRKGVVEKCFTLAPGWGYNTVMEDSTKLMSLKRLKRLVADCMVRDMCSIINIGPDRHGRVPRAVANRLEQFGQWTHAMSDAIYGTRGGPWQPVDGQYGWTQRGNMLYLYLLGDYDKSTFSMPTAPELRIKRAWTLGNGSPIKVTRKKGQYQLSGLELSPGDITIIAIETK